MATSNNVKKTEVKKEEKVAETKTTAATTVAKEAAKVETVKEVAPKVEEAKKEAEPKKTAAKKTTTAKKTPAKKTTTTKKAAEKVEKEPAAKKTTTRRTKAVEPSFVLQYQHIEINEEELIARFKEQWAAMGNSEKDIKEMTVYLKPEEYSAYFVINGVDTIQIYL